MASQGTSRALSSLKNLQSTHPLSILKLSEPLTPDSPSSTQTANDQPTPSALEADLIHYKELFSKLRFSYLEQVTKEKFLRAIVGDPPLIVEHAENVELETQLAEVKEELKSQKEGVKTLVEELESRGRDIARRYASIQLQTEQLETLPAEIKNLQASIAALRPPETSPSSVSSPSLTLPLPATGDLIATREAEMAEIDKQIAALTNSTLPRKTRDLERLKAEVVPLQTRAQVMKESAADAKRRREVEFGDGGEDELEVRGRWYRSVESGVRGMLDVEA